LTRLRYPLKVLGFKLAPLSLQLATSIFYGLRLVNEWGTDFGVYFIGGMSIRSDFGLYSGFFDHKGPTYYAFIQLVSWLVPYSKFGAIITLSLTCAIWFSAIHIVLKSHKLGMISSALVMFLSISVLYGQPSNSSIAIFVAALQLISISSAIRFSRIGETKWLVFSAFFLVLASLTRIDSVIIVPLLLYFIYKKQEYRGRILLVFFSMCLTLFFTILILFAKLLHFGLQDFWQQAIIFNFSVYPDFYGTFMANSHLVAAKYLLMTLIKHGLLVLFLLLLVAFRIKPQNLFKMECFWVVIYGFFAYFLVGSAKDYHLFIFYVFLFIGVIVFFSEQNTPKNLFVLVSFVLLFVMAVSTMAYFTKQSICLITQEKCYEPYSEILVESEKFSPRKVEFVFNQGWPYLFIQTKPNISFTPYFPLAKSFDRVSESFIAESNSGESNSVFWVNDNDIDSLRKSPGNLVDDFLADKVLIRTTNTGYSAYLNIDHK
jgi:hypothetical protein